MNLFKVVGYDIRDFFTSWLTYLFLFLSAAPAVGIIIASKLVDNVSSNGYFIAYAFASFAIIFVVVSAVRVFSKDISEKTNVLFMNSKYNRSIYAIAKTVSMAVIGFIYGLILVIILLIGKAFGADLLEPVTFLTPAAHENVGHLLGEALLGYAVIATVFGTIYFFFSLFIRRSVFIFVIAVIFTLFYPIVESLGSLAFSALFKKDANIFLEFLQTYFPFSAATNGLSGISITNPQFLMLGIYFIVFFILTIIKIRKADY
ncbi:hypothetical protein [Phocicoccus pinnipedialis]|uniref:ABC-2 family transporter protein n=1 Tax=Phocicoccus pinnipedialis TaxID=110845 RepID=A0A6V7RDB5_9BACL|nr:hypothetical protein [Jeotgalicoccus pinnipedialis]MBP1939456.1 MFS family permease [Jeotgalicoccus pinnipedialis]CAD2075345.1 hypothetical protein JEOPIN946_00984 [Jeotgalicoccus pinnipedialis]